MGEVWMREICNCRLAPISLSASPYRRAICSPHQLWPALCQPSGAADVLLSCLCVCLPSGTGRRVGGVGGRLWRGSKETCRCSHLTGRALSPAHFLWPIHQSHPICDTSFEWPSMPLIGMLLGPHSCAPVMWPYCVGHIYDLITRGSPAHSMESLVEPLSCKFSQNLQTSFYKVLTNKCMI